MWLKEDSHLAQTPARGRPRPGKAIGCESLPDPLQLHAQSRPPRWARQITTISMIGSRFREESQRRGNWTRNPASQPVECIRTRHPALKPGLLIGVPWASWCGQMHASCCYSVGRLVTDPEMRGSQGLETLLITPRDCAAAPVYALEPQIMIVKTLQR